MRDPSKLPVRPIPPPTRRKARTASQVAAILEAQDHRCATCGMAIGDDCQIDHIVPLELCGSNDVANLQALCANCHKAKTAGDIAKFAKVRRLRGETCARRGPPIRSRGFDTKRTRRFGGTVKERP